MGTIGRRFPEREEQGDCLAVPLLVVAPSPGFPLRLSVQPTRFVSGAKCDIMRERNETKCGFIAAFWLLNQNGFYEGQATKNHCVTPVPGYRCMPHADVDLRGVDRVPGRKEAHF